MYRSFIFYLSIWIINLNLTSERNSVRYCFSHCYNLWTSPKLNSLGPGEKGVTGSRVTQQIYNYDDGHMSHKA